MKKKGFTLIELLAVIVILAIILLIAIPIVQKTIQDSKDASNEASVKLYGRAVDQAVERYQIKEGKNPKSFEDLKDYIEYTGDRVVCKTTNLNTDMTVYLKGCTVGDSEKEYTYGTLSLKKYTNGEVVYFDVLNGVGCNTYHEDNSKTNYNGIDNPNTNQNNCLKFYTFNDTLESETVNLILDHNTTAIVAWTSSINSSNKNGPIEVITQLEADTKDWDKNNSGNVIMPDAYSMDQTGQTSNAKYIVNYTTKARLITAQEIAQMVGYEGWNETKESTSPYYYFDSKTQTPSLTCKEGNTSGCQYGWLYDRTATDCEIYGCLHNADSTASNAWGYWTASSPADKTDRAWSVSYNFVEDYFVNDIASFSGVRPVITVLKSSLK